MSFKITNDSAHIQEQFRAIEEGFQGSNRISYRSRTFEVLKPDQIKTADKGEIITDLGNINVFILRFLDNHKDLLGDQKIASLQKTVEKRRDDLDSRFRGIIGFIRLFFIRLMGQPNDDVKAVQAVQAASRDLNEIVETIKQFRPGVQNT